jgi:hypothetical protein
MTFVVIGPEAYQSTRPGDGSYLVVGQETLEVVDPACT